MSAAESEWEFPLAHDPENVRPPTREDVRLDDPENERSCSSTSRRVRSSSGARTASSTPRTTWIWTSGGNWSC